MRRVINLALFAVVSLVIVAGLLWVFRGQVLRLAGVSMDTGEGRVGGATVPAGYAVAPFATGLAGPRFMAVAPDGTLLVAERGADRVVALPDRDGDGQADEAVVVGTGYDGAHSLAFAADGTLYVAGTGTLFASSSGPTCARCLAAPSSSCRPMARTRTRTVAVLPDGRLLRQRRLQLQRLLGGRSAPRDDPRRRPGRLERPCLHARPAQRGRADGRSRRPASPGPPTTAATCSATTCRRRRSTASRTAPTPAGRAATRGRSSTPSSARPRIRRRSSVGCDGVVAPAATFQAHMAPLGLAFWEGDAFIAFHGSWNRSTKVGYEVRRLPWSADGPAGPDEPFLSRLPRRRQRRLRADDRPASSSGATVRSTSPTTRPAPSTGCLERRRSSGHRQPLSEARRHCQRASVSSLRPPVLDSVGRATVRRRTPCSRRPASPRRGKARSRSRTANGSR